MAKKVIFKVLGWILILQAFNFGIKIVLGFLYLFDELPRHFVAQLVYIFTDFAELFFSPIGWVRIALLGVGMWLILRKYGVKSEDAKT